jgi:hypothetical protein
MPKKGKDWEKNDRVLRGLPPYPSSTEAESGAIRDQPPEDGGPVRGPEDEPFVRDPDLVEADHTVYTGDTGKK